MTPREGRPRRGIALAGLGGFVLGAATVLLIVWLYGGGASRPPAPAPAPPPAATVQPAPPPSAAPPPVPAPAPAAPGPAATADLARRNLLIPVDGVTVEQLHDTFSEARGGERVHEAMDILAPRNTPVVAVEDGRIAKLFNSVQGGLTIYQFDPSSTYAYYYAHLERYAAGLREGSEVRRGQVLGYVGTTGNAPKDTPHLHFAIFQLGPERNWWQGTPLNPYPFLQGSVAAAGGSRPSR